MKLLEKLIKLANDLDRLEQFDDADSVDEMIRAIAVGDIDEEPVDLTEEDVGPEDAKVPSSPLDVPSPVAQSNELAELRRQHEELVRENELLKLKKMRSAPSGGLKVSPKGALSVYGLGRWPVTLYKSQWASLLDMKEKILQFIKENDQMLKSKE